jgi:hypothetical protein
LTGERKRSKYTNDNKGAGVGESNIQKRRGKHTCTETYRQIKIIETRKHREPTGRTKGTGRQRRKDNG